jgi:DNA-directed RNA polymerase subunit beta'
MKNLKTRENLKMEIKNIDQCYEELKKQEVTFQTKYKFNHPFKTGGLSKNYNLGRILFNLILPDDYPFIDKVINKKELTMIIRDILNKYPAEKSSEILFEINKESFKMGTFHPVSFNDESFILPDEIKKRKLELLVEGIDPIEFAKQIEILGKELLDNLRNNKNPVYDIIMSGAKGSPMDWAVLTVAKGSAVGISGEPSTPTSNSVTDGFTLKEMYSNADESRNGLYTRSSGAALPGALARDIVYANSNVLLGEDDCKTRRYLELYVKDSMRNLILGRFYLNPITNKLEEIKEDHNLINTTIKIRSPLHCVSKDGVCKVCYGRLNEKLNTKHLGILVSSIINDVLLNKTMKARHISSNVNFNKVNFKKDLIKV